MIKLIIVATLFPGINGKGTRNHSTAILISEGLVVETNISPDKTTSRSRQQTRAPSYIPCHATADCLKSVAGDSVVNMALAINIKTSSTKK